VTANGSPLETNGQTTLEFLIGNKLVKGDFIIAKNLSNDIILGVDFLKINKCVIDFNKDNLFCNKQKIDLKSKSSNVVCSTHDFTIEPFSSKIFKTNIPENLLNKTRETYTS